MCTDSNKRGQVTLFIIIAVVIVAGIIILFLFLNKSTEFFNGTTKIDPEQFPQKCARDAVSESVDKILEGGGRINPEKTILFNNEEFNYLCYQEMEFTSCINHYPMIKSIVEQEIKQDTEATVRACLVTTEQELRNRGYTVSLNFVDYDVELQPELVAIKIDANMDYSKGTESHSFKNYNTAINSPIYDLLTVVRRIVNDEAQDFYFKYDEYMLMYPSVKILRVSFDGSRVYRVIDRQSGKEFKFAIKGYMLPGRYI